MTVDRIARERLAVTIENYLGERTTAFGFDEEISNIRVDSNDITVRHVASLLWYHYDDCKDHKVALSRPEWNYIQRLVLILRSEATLDLGVAYQWSATQLVAGVGFAIFVAATWVLGVNSALVAFAIPLGLTSMMIGVLRNGTALQPSSQDEACCPFQSFQQLASIRRQVAGFAKRRQPAHIAARQVRSPGDHTLLRIQQYLVWLSLSPAVLIVQAFPRTTLNPKVLAPSERA